MAHIRLVFLWHQHQPFYKDLVSGEYRLPWVRLHALKDYYGMVKLLDEFPQIHQTFNLVPSLIVQIQEYVAGTASDAFLRVAAKPAKNLTPEEQRFALDYLFQANPVHLIGRYPRYRELWERLRGVGFNAARAQQFFQTVDYADLQVLSQIAWFDEFFLQDKDVAELVAKGRGFSEDDQRTVISKQKEILGAVLPAYAAAARKGSIEISTSPFYHPILPLICDTNQGAISSPGLHLPSKRFQHPEDAAEQLRRGLDLHEQVFGFRPRGAWPSEGSVSNEVFEIVSSIGLQWMATDEAVLGRSLGTSFARDCLGQLTGAVAEKLYQVYRFEHGEKHLHVIFRDHGLSDLIGFVYASMPAKEAASHFIQNIKKATEPIIEKGLDATVPIILDGENAWEFYPQSGRDFLRRVYEGIQNEPSMQAVTVSEAIQLQKEYPVLNSVTPGSWINANFNVWIGAPEDNKAWDYLSAARDFYTRSAPGVPEAHRKLAWEELLIAEGSDWNWWYGPEHHSANDRDFDELYRKHLTNVYQALGAAPPEYLAQPIAIATIRPTIAPQSAYIHPNLELNFTRYFDWLGAAMYTADRYAGAMHGKQFLLDAMFAGIDESNFCGRLDFAGPVKEDCTVVATIEVVPPAGGVGSDRGARDLRLEASFKEGALQTWRLRLADSEEVIASSEQAAMGAAKVIYLQNLQFRLPFATLDAVQGATLRLRFTLWHDHLPADALPLEGWLEVPVVSEEEMEGYSYNYSPSS